MIQENEAGNYLSFFFTFLSNTTLVGPSRILRLGDREIKRNSTAFAGACDFSPIAADFPQIRATRSRRALGRIPRRTRIQLKGFVYRQTSLRKSRFPQKKKKNLCKIASRLYSRMRGGCKSARVAYSYVSVSTHNSLWTERAHISPFSGFSA